MNSLLISLGAAIVVALLAAFVGPSFVDWNSYRDRLEAQAQQLVCRKVEIAGDLDVQLLPQPVLTTGYIEIAGLGDDVLASAAGTTLSLDLGALLLGGIEVTAMELDRPVFSIAADEAGVLNWAATDAGNGANAGPCAPDVAGVSFRRIGVTNGIVSLQTAAMSAPLTIDHVDAALTSGGPGGPFKFTGAHGEAENRRGFSLSSGKVASGVASRVSGRAALDDTTEASFDGMLDGWGEPLRYVGAVKFQRSVKLKNEGLLRLVAEAKAEIGTEVADISELVLTATDPKTTSTVVGSGRWDVSKLAPKIGLDLKARRIDVAALLGQESTQQSSQNGVVALLEAAKIWVEQAGATGRVTLAVDGAQYREELVQDVSASFNLGAGSLGIETVKAVLPGQSEFGFTGNLFEGETADKLVGTLVFNTRDLKRLLDWAVPQSHKRFADLLPQTHGKMSLTGGVAAETGALEMTGIEGLIDGRSFSGDMSFDLGLPGEIHAALAFDELDLDHLVPSDFSFLALLEGRAEAGAATDTGEGSTPALGLEVEAKRIKLRGRELRGVIAAGEYIGRNLVVERLHIDDLAGSQIVADGEVSFEGAGPVGSGDFRIETKDFPALASVVGADLGKLTGRGPGWLAGLREGAFGGRLEALHEEESWRVGLGLRGELGGTTFSAKITSDAAPAQLASGRIEAGVKLETGNAGNLFAQLGLEALPDTTPDAAASLNFDTVGSTESGFGYSLLFSGLDVVTSAEGNIETAPARVMGRLSVTAKDSNKIADLLGLGRRAPVLPATGLASEFDLKGGTLKISSLSGQLAGVNVSGDGEVQLSGARVGKFTLKADHVSLPWALVSLFGESDADTLIPASSASRAAPLWSTDLIRTDVLNRWPISLELSAKKMDLGGGFWLDGADVAARIGDGKLDLARLEGDLSKTGDGSQQPLPDGAHLSASGEIRGTDIALEVAGKIAARGLSFNSYLTGLSGQSLLGGEVAGEVEFTASGRSLLSLASSLGGSGSVSVSNVVLPRIDGKSVLAVAERSGRGERIKSILAKSGKRKMALEVSPAKIEAANGRVKLGPSPLKTGALNGEVTSYLNLVAGRVDQEIVFTGKAGVTMGVIHAGPVGEMAREVEITGLKSGGLQWREDDAVKAAPVETDNQAANGGSSIPTYGDPVSAPISGDSIIGTSSGLGGPPVGVFDQQVFELPLAEGGGT